jgi:hypothetical protein
MKKGKKGILCESQVLICQLGPDQQSLFSRRCILKVFDRTQRLRDVTYEQFELENCQISSRFLCTLNNPRLCTSFDG